MEVQDEMSQEFRHQDLEDVNLRTIEDEEYNYEEDEFEDYDDDFEDDESSEDESAAGSDEKLDSGNYDLGRRDRAELDTRRTAREEQRIKEVKEAFAKSKKNRKKKERRHCHPSP